jgi:hypothetical protein
MAIKIQLRRDTATAWSTSNPVLSQGEAGFDITNNILKIGNGTDAWNDLPAVTGGEIGSQGIQGIQGIQGAGGIQGLQGVQGTDGNAGGQGTQGIQGYQGVQGIPGSFAGQGIQGIQGPAGLVGGEGIQGVQGIQGTSGAVVPTGNTFYVTKEGSDINNGLTIGTAFATIKYALSQVTSGETIFVGSGIYEEEYPLNVPRDVTLIGAGIRATTIRPTTQTDTNDGFLINGTITFSDFNMKGQYWDNINETGYAFRVNSGAEFNEKSPYIQRISILYSGRNPVQATDPYGFNSSGDGDSAGRGFYANGADIATASIQNAILLNEITMIVPNSVGLYLTNGTRCEALNSFVYFADRAVYLESGAEGKNNNGNTRIRITGTSVGYTPSPGNVMRIEYADSTVVEEQIFSYNNSSQLITFQGKVENLREEIASIEFYNNETLIATATEVTFVDYKDFGAEFRAIGNAYVYGNYGIYCDGVGIQANHIGQNFAYVGSGKDFSNDPDLTVQANEVVALNGAKVYINSINETGDLRFGDADNAWLLNTDGTFTAAGDIVPDTDNLYNLGSPTHQWRHVYTAGGSIYLDNIKLSNIDGKFVATKVINPGEENEAPDPEDSNATSELGGGAASLTVTILGEAYKGFGARYGRVYANSNTDELTVSKIVIFKDTASAATSTIHPTSSQDEFAVTGLADSDIIALFVLYGDTNDEKSLDTLKAFARTAIDTVLLNGGVADQFNTIAAMRSAFYDNINTLTAAAGGLVENFDFFEYDNTFTVSADLSGQGTGSGFNVNSLSYNLENDTISLGGWSNGTGYTQGDQIVIPGTSITYLGNALLSPDNDITVTIAAVNVSGNIIEFTLAGTLPRPPDVWPENNISDGGNDQYDNANYINTNLAQEISYADGVIVEDATSEFGAGSKYVALYDSSIFGFIATGSSAASISTSGNSGADGNSTTDTGALFDTDRTYDPALTNLTLTNDPLWATPVSFTKLDNGDEVDVIIEDDGEGSGVGITRGVQRGIYNPFTEDAWDEDVSPQGTLWNTDSTDDLSDIESRTYTNFFAAYGGSLGNVVPGSTAILYVPTIEKYYLVEWTSWTQNNAGGGFAYTRTEIDVTQVEQGLRFADGSVLTTAEGLGRVKSTASGARRIEEVVGYKEVAVTERTEVVLTTTASRSAVDDTRMWVDITTTTIDDVLDDYNANQVNEDFPIQFSLDNATWYNYNGGYNSDGDERGYFIPTPVTYNQGDTIYFRYTGGGFPVTWWNKSELPGGSSNFRGAVIDYHAYTGESTIIGTIHIVDDDGEDHISHQEVQSGSSDGENDDLWFVTTEGRIQYRRIDGESKTLKVHWTAKVFYGSELYD